MGAVWPITIALIFVGLFALFSDNTAAVSVNATAAPKTANVEDFIVYRNAILSYLESNPTVDINNTADVGPQDITLPPGTTPASFIPSGAGNQVVGNNGTRTIYVWWPAAGSTPAQLSTFAGDATMGIVEGKEWETAGLGVMGTLPLTLPSGDLISVVQLGG